MDTGRENRDTSSTKIGCFSSMTLARSLIEGELRQGETTALRVHLDQCAHCRGRLERLRSEREELYRRFPTCTLPETSLSMWQRARKMWAWRLLATGVAVCAALLVWLRPPEEMASVRFKGEAPSMGFRVERHGKVFEGRPLMRLRARDRIRFQYSLGEDAYLYIVNLDGNGQLTPYFPATGNESAPVVAGEGVFLPGSIRLDDYTGNERIFALFSRQPIRLVTIEAALRSLRAQRPKSGVFELDNLEALPLSVFQTSFLIFKDPEEAGGSRAE